MSGVGKESERPVVMLRKRMYNLSQEMMVGILGRMREV